MELQINNQKVQFNCDKLSIQNMLDIHKPTHQKGIAIAVNQTVITKDNWATYYLNPSDNILIITATQGG
ncbi:MULTISPECIES: sulfur carrier protein ThiS [Myroides]|uniref:sulfur carrier protein ThiS n=1 Tax=Myroides TaxID=76831 RepID=UPI0013031419|nr:sulfur carrier protein ThiS [Myroides phaeus]